MEEQVAEVCCCSVNSTGVLTKAVAETHVHLSDLSRDECLCDVHRGGEPKRRAHENGSAPHATQGLAERLRNPLFVSLYKADCNP